MSGQGANAILDKAWRFYKKDRYRDAAPLFRKFLVTNPGNVGALFCLAHSLQRIGKYKTSLKLWQKFKKLAPTELYLHLNIGCIHQDLGRDDLAIRFFKRELKLYPTCGQALYNLGVLYYQRHLYRTALPYLEKCYYQDHSREEIVCKLAHSYFKNGKIEKELELYALYLETHPEDTWCLNNLGASLMQIGEFNRALLFLRRASKIDPKNQRVIRNIKKTESLRKRTTTPPQTS